MKQLIDQSIHLGLNYLSKHQQESGGFCGLASVQLNMAGATATDTVFFTALIMECLAVVDDAGSIRAQTNVYLLKHKSAMWTWNYWQRDSQARPYPDDLDDTACAVATLASFKPDLITPEAQAAIARALIACELQPGGPYATWLMPPQAQDWRDVDVAVNANIGYMFRKLGVQSEVLESYSTKCLENNTLESRYYLGIVPTLYFLARWYQGSQLPRLEELIIKNINRSDLSALELAMLITAACNLGISARIKSSAITTLLHHQKQGYWPAAALYYEPPQQGVQHYAGSQELTTAFALEALVSWDKRHDHVIMAIEELPQTFKAVYRQLIQREQRAEIIDIAGVIARAGGWKLKESTIRKLNRGSRNGWLAYTIYDDFLDEEGDVARLSIANLAMRQSVNYFKQAINDPGFNAFVEATFEQVDAANFWEVTYARNRNKLPNYGFYSQLAQRSWGHVLAPTGALVLAGYALGSPELTQLHEFFRQYIIAKQLCDDAHDWLGDMRRGHITAVVAMVLRDCESQDEINQQVYFWQITINEVNKLIRQHLDRAHVILGNCEFFVNKTELQAWLTELRQSCLQAEQGRDAALEFIGAFSRLAPHQIEKYT